VGLILGLSLAVAVMLVPSLAGAADQRAPKAGEYNPKNDTVEMFQAIEKGQIGVKLIAKDASQCNVMIENKTDKPLNVKLPDAFAGVPVLAQGGGLGGGRPPNSSSSNNKNQQGSQGMGGGMGMGMFNVPPEKVGQFKAATVCLEHGKKEPHNSEYEVKTIDSFTDKPAVAELCRMLGSGEINQRAAQAAAWHLNNNMTWEQLAAEHNRYADGSTKPYFSPQELQLGRDIASSAIRTAEEKKLEKQKEQKPSGSEYAPAKQ
jgi:hypothetical protein